VDYSTVPMEFTLVHRFILFWFALFLHEVKILDPSHGVSTKLAKKVLVLLGSAQ
jgi:hypothetical protein